MKNIKLFCQIIAKLERSNFEKLTEHYKINQPRETTKPTYLKIMFLNLETLTIYVSSNWLNKEFIAGLDSKSVRKIFYNIDLAEQTNDPKLFKKLQNEIWEFRTKFAGLQIRLLAFWDKTDNQATLMIATHGFIKKVDKVPVNEIDRAVRLKNKYFEGK